MKVTEAKAKSVFVEKREYGPTNKCGCGQCGWAWELVVLVVVTRYTTEGLARSFLSNTNIPLFLLVLSCVGYLELDFLGHDVFILHISVVVVDFFY
jgi:hypothetical protein